MFRDTKAFSGFSVDDIAKAKAFYSEVLGVEVTQDDDLLHLQIASGNPVLIYPKPDHTPATYTILNFPVDDIDQTVDELTRRGVRFQHYDGPLQTNAKGIATWEGSHRQAWFTDPAGNILSVIQTL
ncbi:MAG: VOC family protein [Anaerolineae bacterium]